MSHDIALSFNVEDVIDDEPIPTERRVQYWCWVFILLGAGVFLTQILFGDNALAWGAFYTNVVFWMGLAAGSVMIACIVQIVRAKWSPPIRRIAEANVAFLPWAYMLLLLTWFGKKHLFYWGHSPMPGRETWMEPCFVYLRFAVIFGILFYLMYRYVSLSLRGDIGLLREQAKDKERWRGWFYQNLTRGWKGSDQEVKSLQSRMSYMAPVIVIVYALTYTLFATEMLAGMDPIWFSNMFGGFNFLGNIYIGWTVVGMLTIYFIARHKPFERCVDAQQLWDLGKLMFGFCMLWGYTFWSQFLPQWYSNMPEETQWMILRTREAPWQEFGYMVFAMCFVIPFITLISRDLKRTPPAFFIVGTVILLGVWAEKYIVIMPQISPGAIPFGATEIALFLGFMGAYVLSITNFMKNVPFVPVSHPLTKGSVDW